eukprot:12724493-Alexandrium_andersonii.AAC.1
MGRVEQAATLVRLVRPRDRVACNAHLSARAALCPVAVAFARAWFVQSPARGRAHENLPGRPRRQHHHLGRHL